VAGQVRVGFKIGYTSAWFKTNTHYDFGPRGLLVENESRLSLASTRAKGGIPFGGFVTIPITRYFSFQPEVIFNPKGGKGTLAVTYFGHPQYAADVTLNYIECPILFKGQIPLNSRVGATCFIGPCLAFPVKGEVSSNPEAWTGQSQREIANLQNPDFTIALGIGVEIKTGKNLLAIELRTSYSQISEKSIALPVSSSIAPDKVALLGLTESPPRTAMVLVGYSFGL
jgi:hypothetical protein